MINWPFRSKERHSYSSEQSSAQSKIGTMMDWSTRAEYYHVNWVKEKVGPFKVTERLVKALEVKPNDFVLDIGCGTGAVSKEISPLLAESGTLVGIDLSRTALNIARSWVSSPAKSNSSFIQMDAENIGLRNIFDKVACQYALSFFVNPQRSLKEIRKVMKTQGKIGVAVHGAEETVPYLSTILEAVSKHMPSKVSKALLSVHRLGTGEILSEILTDAGFSDVSISKYSYEYTAGTFENYWSEFFLNGFGNALQYIIFDPKNQFVNSRIKADAEEIALRYTKNGIIHFPWEVLVATACS